MHPQLGVELVFPLAGRSVLLLRIGKAAQPLKAHGAHKLAQLLKVLLSLAGETGNQGGAQHHARHLVADFLHQRAQRVKVSLAVHLFEHPAAGVLQGQVDVFDHLRLLRHDLQQAVGHPIRVAVQHPDPVEAVDLAQLGQQLIQRVLTVQVLTVFGGVLRHQVQLLDAAFRKASGLLQESSIRRER